MPDRFVDQDLGTFIAEFKAEAAARGRVIDGKLDDKLRRVEYVDDIDGKRRDYGQTGPSPLELSGACTDARLDNVMGSGRFKVDMGEAKWSEIWISAKMIRGARVPDRRILKELMFHELGHCLLDLEHKETGPHGIMSPVMHADPAWIEANWSDLLKELFGA